MFIELFLSNCHQKNFSFW